MKRMEKADDDEAGKEQPVTLCDNRIDLTAQNVLDVCSLPKCNKESKNARKERLNTLKEWHCHQSELLKSLLFHSSDSKSGCFPLHWAAGTGFDEAVSFILTHYSSEYEESHIDISNNVTQQEARLLVNQWAVKPSTGRTPLHYAARNNHLSTCKLLVQTYCAQSNPKCHRGSVTPLQLAVWQNQLDIVKYLVSIHHNDDDSNNIVLETNAFRCGLNHWIGLVPQHRWLSKDGSGVLPMARFLHTQGVSYTSTPNNQQNQGHTPLHKAAWGGNISLLQYYREEHNVFDSIQDACGNYAADLAQMGGHINVQEWLHRHASLDRHESYKVLGLPVSSTTKAIEAQYKSLAKLHHPDRNVQQQQDAGGGNDTFVRIKQAYEHLIHQDGIGHQRNPKYQALQMLTANGERTQVNKHNNHVATLQNSDDLFHARILAIVSDYGDKGFPISAISKRWNQIWPDCPFPTSDEYLIPVVHKQHNIQKKVKLLKYLKWKCGSVVSFRKENGVELAFRKNP